jgi:Ca-activated chloride channel homolog
MWCALAPAPHAQVVFRSSVELVRFGVTVVDKKGNLVTALTKQDFQVTEDGAKQEVKFFAPGEPAGDESEQPGSSPDLHLGLLFDASGSMDEDIAFSRSACIKFLNELRRAADVTLVDFDTEVRVARYGQNDFARLVERIRRRKPDGWTALYDALGVYLDGAGGQDGRKILVIYSDGGDNRSSATFSEALDLLKASDVTVYSVGFLQHQSQSSQLEQRMRLQQIADVTGGQAFFPYTLKELDATYEKVEKEIRAQYNLGYVSTNLATDGTWRKVEIKLGRPDLKVRTRKGYFAPFKAPH